MRVLIIFLIAFFNGLIMVNGQYFGRNKVKYEQFKFKIYETEHFSIHYYKDVETQIAGFASAAEDWYYYESQIFNHQFEHKNPIIVYSNDADFQQTAIISSLIGEGTGGVTEGIKNRVILPLSSSYSSTNHVLGHELVHAFQYNMILTSDSLSLNEMANIPLWLVEGMAEYVSIGSKDPLTAMWMRDAVLNDDIPDIKKLTTDMSYFPYRYGHSLVGYIAGKWGDKYLRELLFNTAAMGGINQGIFKTFGFKSDSLSLMWKNELIQIFKPQLEKRLATDSISQTILGPEIQGGEYNVGPVLSPDGQYVAFFSERDIFTFDLFVAETESGNIIKKLGSQEADPHFNAIRFIESAGCWSPDSKRFAAVTYSAGNNDIAIFNLDNKEIENLGINTFGTIYNPSWSKDGNTIVFTGTTNGISDLFSYDLKTKSITRLTNDKFANLQATWSVDGKTIAFITDRNDSSRSGFGVMKLAFFTISDSTTKIISPLGNVNCINPQYNDDGTSLYFVADRNGFMDVYRLDLISNEVFQITKVPTGVSGITNLSPALSYASDKLFFGTYIDHKYLVHSLNTDRFKGELVSQDKEEKRGDLLPPIKKDSANKIDDFLAKMPYNENSDSVKIIKNYRPKISLDYLGNVAVGVGVSSFGVGVLGGINLRFSDMLNEHILFTGLSLNGTLKDISAQVAYLNQKKRLLKGILLSHETYLSISTVAYIDTLNVNGENLQSLVIEQDFYRTFNNQVGLIGMYPVTTNHRIESSLSFNRISYDVQRFQDYYINGFYFDTEESSPKAPDPINLFSIMTAWVGDKSYFGMTSPLKGQRYRLESNVVLGSLDFATFLADYRKYQFVKPFTLAFRALHYGRYFGDSESRRLSSSFIGYGVFVRGYGPNSFEREECITTGDGGCPVQDRLFGSKILVGNFEIRYPLIGARQLSAIHTRILPVTLSVFFDYGVAWYNDDKPIWKFSSTSLQRIPVMSTGVSARVNILGAMILEVYYAYPYQRPVKGGHIGLVLSPGW